MIEPAEAKGLIRNYEEIIKTQHERFIVYITKQGEVLKKFKDAENFIENLKQNRSMVYYNISFTSF